MSTSVLHSVKESLFSGDSHVDAEYDTAIARFVQLQKQTDVLKAAAADYCNSHYKTLSKSNLVSESFAQILEDPLSETGFETLSKQMLSAHSQLNADRQCALTARMSEGVLVPLEKLHLHLLNLHTKTTKRNELHKNLEYYLRKVGQLIRDREERAAKGKTETESQKDKLTRNQTKLDTVRQQYTTYAQPLIVELSSVWNTRTNYLGPVLAAFASVEKEFVRVYSTALDEVRPEVVSSAAAQPRVELTVPPVEGSSLIAPAGLDAAPIHTAQVGTVDATQSTFIHKAADPAAITASSATGLPLASIGQLPSQQQPEQLKSTTTTVTGAAPLNTHNSSETSQQLDLLTPKQQPISSSTITTSGTEILSAPQAGTIDAAQSAVLQQQQPIQQLEGQQRSTIKSEHEEESKAQRFEQEHKTATQII